MITNHPWTWLVVAFGGALGSMARYGINLWWQQIGLIFPGGTLIVNVSGCFVFGLGMQYFDHWLAKMPLLKVFLFVGCLGAFTTFSTFAYETIKLWQNQAFGLTLANLLAQLILSLTALWFGLKLGAWFSH